VAVVVVDKCYLQGASRAEVANLLAQHHTIMPAALLHELLTGDERDRARCFSVLPPRDNPLLLVEDPGPLIRYEASNRRPCTPLTDRCLKGAFQFNPRLNGNEFVISDEARRVLSARDEELALGIEGYREAYSLVPNFFPELIGLRPGEKPELVARIIRDIATAPEIVKTFYDAIRPEFLPPVSLIDENWVIYRWAQVRLLDAVDTFSRYGAGGRPLGEKAVNAHIDVEYTILASLAGGLASRDKEMISRFRLLRPDGVLIS
jgi:hypothetical protein